MAAMPSAAACAAEWCDGRMCAFTAARGWPSRRKTCPARACVSHHLDAVALDQVKPHWRPSFTLKTTFHCIPAASSAWRASVATIRKPRSRNAAPAQLAAGFVVIVQLKKPCPGGAVVRLELRHSRKCLAKVSATPSLAGGFIPTALYPRRKFDHGRTGDFT